MKNTYRVILIGLAVLGVVYASTEPEKKTEEAWKYKPIDLCKFPVSMEVGHFVELKGCNKRKIKLVQVDCECIGRDGGDFPCYKGSDVIEVRTNFPAILSASLNKSAGGEDMLKEVNLYWENGVNTIQGTGEWEELKLCLDIWNVEIWKSGGTIGTVNVGEITICVRPPDDTEQDVPATSQKEVRPGRIQEDGVQPLEEAPSETAPAPKEAEDVVRPSV